MGKPPTRNLLFVLLSAILLACLGAPACALQPSEILLITNRNNPDSARLAAIYAGLRKIPDGQTLALDLPDAEEMNFDVYETRVVAPTRQFLTDHHLENQIKCLLTFYGVPFRISAKQNTPEELKELADLKQQQKSLLDQVRLATEDFEHQTIALDPQFKPAAGDSLDQLAARAAAAELDIGPKIDAITDLAARAKALQDIQIPMQELGGPAEIDARFGTVQRSQPFADPKALQPWLELHKNVVAATAQLRLLQGQRWDAQARAQLRKLSADMFGALAAARAVNVQIDYFTTDATTAGTDNELALLWWEYYARGNWQPNPLALDVQHNPQFIAIKAHFPRTLMVMRLDGPDPKIVESMMRTSIDVEKAGLTGTVALDARGIPPTNDKNQPDPYGVYDEKIRDLALILHKKTTLKVVLDDQDLVFPPHSVKNVALYCGWYSVGKYIPGCDFNPGAVGFHIASYEMITLHHPTAEWVANLLHDGVVGTLGPVAEPYLTAFPAPNEFFPLLLTGKLTLAEVYWKTTPETSWMINCIGDPLYNPYQTDPAIKVEDLPDALKAAFAPEP